MYQLHEAILKDSLLMHFFLYVLTQIKIFVFSRNTFCSSCCLLAGGYTGKTEANKLKTKHTYDQLVELHDHMDPFAFGKRPRG